MQQNLFNSSSSLAFSPGWALEGAETEPFPIQYGLGRDTVMKEVDEGDVLADEMQSVLRYGASPFK
jgi:hypothetical protein